MYNFINITLTYIIIIIKITTAQASADYTLSHADSVDRLMGFSKLYGALRYFYPGFQLSPAAWEKFIETGAAVSLSAENPEAFIQKLNHFCGSRHVFISRQEETFLDVKSRNGIYRYWLHRGYGVSTGKVDKGLLWFIYRQFGPYRSHIKVAKKKGTVVPDSLYQYVLTENIALQIRHALYIGDKTPRVYRSLIKTLYKNQPQEPNAQLVRVGTAIYTWNVLRHFYPYPEHMEADWDSMLSRILSRALSDTSHAQFYFAVREMISDLNDGHGGVRYAGLDVKHKPPVTLNWIENQVVIENCRSCDSLGIRKGDVLLAIDGVPVKEALARQLQLTSASTWQDKMVTAANFGLLNGKLNSSVTIKVNRSEEKDTIIELKRTVSSRDLYFNSPSELPVQTVLEGNVVYIDITRSDQKSVTKILSEIKEERGIVFDMRGYPNMGFPFLGFLSKEKILNSQQWLIPLVERPFQVDMHFDTSHWVIPRHPYTIPESCKVVFLTNEKAVSAAETLMSIVKYYRLGTIIGSATAGTNGNVITTDYRKLYTFFFTGMKVLWQDNAPFHGTGVFADIEVKPTVAGMREGRDEVLEYALEFIINHP